MKERLKSILLFSLVGISILMGQKIWIQIPQEAFKVFKDKEKPVFNLYLISDMITPNKYLLNFNQENKTLAYDDFKYGMWSRAKDSLRPVLNSKDIETNMISQDTYEDLLNEKSILFYFPEDINTNILIKAWNIKNPGTISDAIPNINRIYIYLGSKDPFFVFSKDEEHLSIYDEKIDTSDLIRQLDKISEEDYDHYYTTKDFLKTNNNIYTPDKIRGNLPRVEVANIIPTLKNEERIKLVEGFFDKSIDYIREMVESNGSTIYVYNQKTLKLNINGLLEYFHALDSPVKSRNLYASLSAAADFITEKNRAQEGMYIAEIEEIELDNSLGYRFIFRYRINGLPVILDNREIEEYIEMEVFNHHIRSYKHLLREDISLTPNKIPENKLMLSSYDVIDENYPLLRRIYIMDNNITLEDPDEDMVYEVLNSIEDIDLAFYDPYLKDKEEELIGVWAIRIGGRLLAFDVYDGELVYER